MRRLLFVVILLALLAGCGEATPTAVPFHSTGIGATVSEWEAVNGKTDAAGKSRSPYQIADNKTYIVTLLRDWSGTSGPTLDAARSEIKGMLPDDTTLVRTIPSSGKYGTKELYHSATLAKRVPASAWQTGTPGDIILGFAVTGGHVTSIIADLGAQ